MAKKQSDSVYRIVDVVGVSKESWEDAGRRAVETAAGSLRDLRVAEVTKVDMRVQEQEVYEEPGDMQRLKLGVLLSRLCEQQGTVIARACATVDRVMIIASHRRHHQLPALPYG